MDSQFGKNVAQIASRVHVWLVGSETNRVAAQSFREQHQDKTPSIETGITVFATDPSDELERSCIAILGTIDIHHGEYSHEPPLSAVEVYGLPLSGTLQSAFEAYGFSLFQTTSYGFFAANKTA